jgi:hypothetical protein
VKTDDALRVAAVVAAAALLAAPYWAQIKAAAGRVVETGKEKAGFLARLAAAALILAAAWGKLPLPSIPVVPSAPVAVETPSDEMKTLVQPIADALRGASAVDRALWAETWNKAAVVAAGDAVTTEVAFTDSRALRLFTALAIDIAWRRIGKHVPGSQESLRQAVEAAYGQAVGADVVPVTADLRSRYVAFAKAVAWAGMNGG